MSSVEQERAVDTFRVLQRLSHPHLIEFHDLFQTESHIYIGE